MNRLCEVAFCAIAVILCCVTRSSATPAPADQPITVTRFVIDGAESLSASQIEEVKASVMGRPPESGIALMDTAKHRLMAFLNGSCYIRADIDLDVVNAQAAPDAAWMHAVVRQGTRYRLGNFRVQWAQAFSTQEIGQHVPLDAMRRGDCSGLDGVESSVTDFYRSRGFPNVKVHPLVQADKATKQFDLTLYIDEGK
jgi:outer membrane protein assembly factor BamA